jgi:hypothetical protein
MPAMPDIKNTGIFFDFLSFLFFFFGLSDFFDLSEIKNLISHLPVSRYFFAVVFNCSAVGRVAGFLSRQELMISRSP